MFGAVCSGRPMQLAAQVEPSKYVISIPNASSISHIAIFLLPQTEFTDPNFTALIYFQLPNSQEFKLLGGLNPLKPSGIYKLNNNAAKSSIDSDALMEDDVIDTSDSYTINIGLSIEPTDQAEIQLAQEKAKTSGNSSALVVPSRQPHVVPQTPDQVATLANKIVSHAYNYLGSFVDAAGKVPMKAFDNWWEKFKSKLASNPSFLDQLQD